MNKIATVFGGAWNKPESQEYQDTVFIGQILAKNGYIVKTGGYYGMMEAVSKGAHECGGITIGYTCKIFPSTKGNPYLTETIVTENMYDRLQGLIDDADLYIVLPGGLGTLAEMFLTLDLIRKKNDKPNVLLVGEIWKGLNTAILPFFKRNEENLYTIIDSKNILNYI